MMNYDRVFLDDLAEDVMMSLDSEIWVLEQRIKDIDMLSRGEHYFSPDKAEEVRATERLIKAFKRVESYYKLVYGFDD